MEPMAQRPVVQVRIDGERLAFLDSLPGSRSEAIRYCVDFTHGAHMRDPGGRESIAPVLGHEPPGGGANEHLDPTPPSIGEFEGVRFTGTPRPRPEAKAEAKAEALPPAPEPPTSKYAGWSLEQLRREMKR